MYIRLKENQEQHDMGVVYYVNFLSKKGFLVYADLPSMIKPKQIGDYIPDIYATNGNEEIIIEVETMDSVSSSHARGQNLTFGVWSTMGRNRKYEQKII
jgi:hypothetical protein